MHNAPSVSYPVGRCAFQRWLYLVFTLMSSTVVIAWALEQNVGWVWCVALSAVVLGAFFGWRSLQQQAILTWDGQVWCLHDQSTDSEDALGHVQVTLDVQKALLLRWQPTSDRLGERKLAPVWLWLGAEQSTSHWQDLRRAVYQRVDIH